MKIGILQCGHPQDEIKAKHGDYAAMFARLLAGNDFQFETWDVVDLDFPSSIFDADGWLLSGSKHGAYDGLPFIAPLEEFVRNAYAAEVPLVGICFGHQLIAQALGGRVEKFRGGWSVGRNLYDFDGEGALALNAWHQDQVVEKPKDAECLAGNDFCQNAALIYGNRALTVQAHPEFTNEIIDDMIRLRRGLATLPSEILDAAAGKLGQMPDNAVLGRRIADFFLAHSKPVSKVAHG